MSQCTQQKFAMIAQIALLILLGVRALTDESGMFFWLLIVYAVVLGELARLRKEITSHNHHDSPASAPEEQNQAD